MNLYPRDDKGRKYTYIDHIPRPAQKPVGYCWNATHYGLLSKKHVKTHGCLKKNCRYLERFTLGAEGYWNNKETKRENKKMFQELRAEWLKGKMSTQEYLKRKKELENV